MNKENEEEVKSNVCPICGKPIYKRSKYCIFHASKEEKTEEDFKKSLKEYIQEIKEKDKDYDLEGFIFIGDIDFEKDLNITIFKNANFENATFEGNANFDNTTFEGRANFWKTTFKKYADFWKTTFKRDAFFDSATFEGEAIFANATFDFEVFKMADTYSPSKFEELFDFSLVPTFEGGANFKDATFKRYADFDDATFKGFADFDNVTFKRNAFFKDATFKKYANFWKTTFEGGADFDDVTFKGGANFDNVTFKGNANFDSATFEGYADFIIKASGNMITFTNSLFTQGKTLVIKTTDIKNKVTIDFEKACLENVYLKLDLGVGTSINFTDALLRNTKMEKDQIENHILQKEQDYLLLKNVYLLLKNNFHSIGRYDDESWAFKKEKDMGRKSNCHFKTLHKWLWSCFLNAIYGYGEKPERVIISAILIILIYAFVFMNYGIVADPRLDNLPKYNILKELFMGIRHGNLLIRFKDIPWEQIKNCLYFSTVTFTTLGLGDFRPVEVWGRMFVGTEAFIGAFMIALFVYTFARRTGGR